LQVALAPPNLRLRLVSDPRRPHLITAYFVLRAIHMRHRPFHGHPVI
jgi:hypothetical protein